MDERIDRVKNIRHFLLEQVGHLMPEQMNEIPAGFNNNIAWNLAHLVASQQAMCYLRSGLSPVVEGTFISRYASGTKPEDPVDRNGLEEIKKLSFSTIDRLDEDYRQGLFKEYEVRHTRYGVTLHNIEDVLQFLLFHEGFHLAAVMTLKRFIKQG
ncbi:DinB family protein [Compostibacter hankyongensis]|uniref:DinB-like domain-containing protein n=1 Tax=Compostibacter hankyongensis TaxID=1007089 RepID=A0ABP8FSG6_9BACT